MWITRGLCLLVQLGVCSSLVSKCINRGDEKVTMNCPDDHVIYRPIIFVGASAANSCTFQDGDCTGLTYGLITQRNKCFWQNHCTMRWRDQLPMVSANSDDCNGKLPSYVNFENPLCVPKDNIIDICSPAKVPSSSSHGVIRSHEAFPWAYSRESPECRASLKTRVGKTLIITIDEIDLNDKDLLLIKKSTNIAVKDFYFRGERILHRRIVIEGTGHVDFTFNVTDGEKSASGFTLRYEYVEREFATNIPTRTKTANGVGRPLDIFHDSLFNEYGSIHECITRKREKLNITCPSGHVIYKPEMNVGVSNVDSCMYESGDCTGMTHTFLSQSNVCYWKSSCQYRWNAGIPITMSTSLQCLAMPPKYISLSGYKCVREDHVFDLCDRRSALVLPANLTQGIIKSHSHYPWHYKTSMKACRKKIRVPKRLGLRLRTDDIDLDPDSKRDSLKIYHVTGKKTLKKKARGSDAVDETFYDGCVQLEFRVSQRSKAGRGFILKFETALPGPVSPDELGDCEEPVKKRRLKTKSRRKGGKRTSKPRTKRRNRKRKSSKRRRKSKKQRRGKKTRDEVHPQSLFRERKD